MCAVALATPSCVATSCGLLTSSRASCPRSACAPASVWSIKLVPVGSIKAFSGLRLHRGHPRCVRVYMLGQTVASAPGTQQPDGLPVRQLPWSLLSSPPKVSLSMLQRARLLHQTLAGCSPPRAQAVPGLPAQQLSVDCILSCHATVTALLRPVHHAIPFRITQAASQTGQLQPT